MTQEIFEAICKKIETSTLGIKHHCKELGVSKETFYEFRNKSVDNSNLYARAKELQAELIADEIVDIADDGSNDFMTTVKGDKEYEHENKEVTNRSRLRVDSRKWLLSKLLPKKYGDKVEHDIHLDIGDKLAEARARVNKIE